MERRSYGGSGLTGSAHRDLGRLLAGLGVAVPIRHAVSTVVDGPASPIQTAALEDAVAGRDLLAVAPTGSGKTLVFAIGVAHRLAGAPSLPDRPRAIVVAPTRELAVQNAEVLAEVGAGAGLRVATFVGGQPLSKDRRTLVAPVDIAVGTPGRLTDLIRTGALSTADVSVLVLDEADHLMGLSFGEQTAALLAECGDAALLSTTATADTDVEDALRSRRPGLRIHRVDSPVDSAPPTVAAAGAPRRLVVVSAPDPDLYAIALAARCRRALFFVPRRDAVEQLRASIAATGVTAAGVAGSASPTRRAGAFADLASGTVRVLVSTDLAGRGLDLDGIGHVIHVGPPHSVQDLVHRSGRTGRGDDAAGVVAAIVRPSEVARISALAREVGMTVDLVDPTGPRAAPLLDELFGPEIALPRRRRESAPSARSRRPAQSRVHRPKKKRRS
ncbi:DEAD/DEAH box helicase [Dietzia psychralcaliphila]|uniref:DEAD/DEAH box helicase n=1 Tax=Dietzia psychralcaliphila TaxID=139021 RepID=UPI001C1E28DB|nr:DEAD/DEAH box helicase [Dietzia psychralcaliphila]